MAVFRKSNILQDVDIVHYDTIQMVNIYTNTNLKIFLEFLCYIILFYYTDNRFDYTKFIYFKVLFRFNLKDQNILFMKL